MKTLLFLFFAVTTGIFAILAGPQNKPKKPQSERVEAPGQRWIRVTNSINSKVTMLVTMKKKKETVNLEPGQSFLIKQNENDGSQITIVFAVLKDTEILLGSCIYEEEVKNNVLIGEVIQYEITEESFK